MKSLFTTLSVLFVIFLFASLSNAEPWDPEEGERLFTEKCMKCHEPASGSRRAPELVDCGRCGSIDELFEKIDKRMPPRKPFDCKDECAKNIAAYIYVIKNNNALPDSLK